MSSSFGKYESKVFGGFICAGISKDYSDISNASYYAPGVLHRGTYFWEQSCISIKFRYNTNKDCFLISLFI